MIVLGAGARSSRSALSDPGVAVVAATAGGLAGVLVAAPIGAAARAAFVGTRELRALAIAGALAILATAWLARPLGDLVAVPAVFGLAYLAFAAARRDPVRGDPVPPLGGPRRRRRARASRCRS